MASEMQERAGALANVRSLAKQTRITSGTGRARRSRFVEAAPTKPSLPRPTVRLPPSHASTHRTRPMGILRRLSIRSLRATSTFAETRSSDDWTRCSSALTSEGAAIFRLALTLGEWDALPETFYNTVPAS